MSEDRPITLEFIAAQLQRVLAELRMLRDDVDVLAAITRRLDDNQAVILDELVRCIISSSAPRRACGH